MDTRDIRADLAGGRRRSMAARKVRCVAALARGVAICVVLLTLGACVGNEHMSFLDPQGPVARAQMVHFYWVLGIMVVFVAGPILLALPFFLWRYRYRNKDARYAPKWRDLGLIAFLTWAGPVLIVCALGYFVWRDSHRLDPYRPLASSQPALQVQVIGYDWKWLFIYPKRHIATIGTLALPAGRPVTLHLTSATVMQSFFIPALGSQIYAMGGMVTQLNLEANKPGRFLGENTMYNGDGFHDQKFTAVAMNPHEFEAWIARVKATGTPLDADILKAISARDTRAQLIAKLPHTAVRDGNVYLTDVATELFARVVKATLDGTSPVVPVAEAAQPVAAAGAKPGVGAMDTATTKRSDP